MKHQHINSVAPAKLRHRTFFRWDEKQRSYWSFGEHRPISPAIIQHVIPEELTHECRIEIMTLARALLRQEVEPQAWFYDTAAMAFLWAAVLTLHLNGGAALPSGEFREFLEEHETQFSIYWEPVAHRLEQLGHDMNAGRFGDDLTFGNWMQRVEGIVEPLPLHAN